MYLTLIYISSRLLYIYNKNRREREGGRKQGKEENKNLLTLQHQEKSEKQWLRGK